MKNRSFTLAFVGGAPNSAAGRAHFTACRMDGLWELQAGCFSQNTRNNQFAAEEYGVAGERLYPSLDSLIEAEKGRADAIAILTPTPLHFEMARKCLEAGFPVICEKSLSLTSAEARELEKVRERKNGFLAVIYNYSGYPIVRELRRMIRDGDLGEILHFQAEMPQEGYLRTDGAGNKPNVQDWRQKDGAVPTIHLDLAVHLHELIFYLTSERPVEVAADQSSHGWLPVVDNVSCLARYTHDVQSQLWFSKSALGHRNGMRLRIYGSKASAEWHQMNPEELLLNFSDGHRQIFDRASGAKVASLPRYNRFKAGHPAGFNEALANLYSDIHECLEGYRSTGKQDSEEVFGAGVAIEGLEFLEAMVRSCSTRQWEAVGEAETLKS